MTQLCRFQKEASSVQEMSPSRSACLCQEAGQKAEEDWDPNHATLVQQPGFSGYY